MTLANSAHPPTPTPLARMPTQGSSTPLYDTASLTARAAVPIESDGNSTVRPRQARPVTKNDPAAAASRVHASVEASGSSLTVSDATSSASQCGSAKRTSRHGSTSGKSRRLSWYVELDRAPSTTEMQKGPIPLGILEEQLALNDDTVNEINELEDTTEFDVRLCVEADKAFVYRPVILEGPRDQTYLLGWGDATTTAGVEDWLRGKKDLHLFCHPATSEISGWFYLGLHTFSYAPGVDSVWGKLEKEDKNSVLVELQARNPGMDLRRFKHDVKKGRLVQCCIRIESRDRTGESTEFLREYGLLAGDGGSEGESDSD
ncbi:uncharacterized protein BXZ73DRAFT_102757 [Epithele typhae]|uniref:uncharacterized protein n=1 Tax=Epithele typhae TaxID=378194 RepID=UPI0020086FFD|nr:uncharacterized protein BXZ73DRAFT_102757 [Epithele typhae]KAH9927169.1 hypothetical protein BXZ73DRAFT_102757 [Epithele typhae]